MKLLRRLFGRKTLRVIRTIEDLEGISTGDAVEGIVEPFRKNEQWVFMKHLIPQLGTRGLHYILVMRRVRKERTDSKINLPYADVPNKYIIEAICSFTFGLLSPVDGKGYVSQNDPRYKELDTILRRAGQ